MLKISFFALTFCVFSLNAQAMGSKPPAPFDTEKDAPVLAPTTVLLTPTTVREFLLQSDDIYLGINRVYQVKDRLNIARAELLPKIDIGGTAMAITNPGFMLSQIQFLLPFLMPSKWFDLGAASNLYKSEKEAYQILQLNLTASALGAYVTIMQDYDLRDRLQEDAADFEQLRQIVEKGFAAGIATRVELDRASSNANLASIRAAKARELIFREEAILHEAMELPSTAKLVLVPEAMPESELEQLPIETAVERVTDKSPEYKELVYLRQAAVDQRLSTMFSWIGGMTASLGNAGGRGGLPFNQINASGFLTLDFAIFPKIQLGSDHIKAIDLQIGQIPDSFRLILERAIQQLPSATRRLSLARAAEEASREAYQLSLQGYVVGRYDVNALIQARQAIRESFSETIAAQTDMNAIRLQMHRADLSGEFASLKGCDDPPEDMQRHHWWERHPKNPIGNHNFCLPSLVKTL